MTVEIAWPAAEVPDATTPDPLRFPAHHHTGGETEGERGEKEREEERGGGGGGRGGGGGVGIGDVLKGALSLGWGVHRGCLASQVILAPCQGSVTQA